MAERKMNNLKEAEFKANDIIRKAQERKAKMLDEAGAAADKEIAVIREKYQKEFDAKKYDTTEEEKKQAEITKREIQEVYQQYEKHASACIEFMLDRMLQVDHAVGRNIKADFSVLK